MPFVFSHNDQIHPETGSFICRQIEAKLMLVDGRVSKSKKESIWKLWVHHLSVAINKTASRNVLRKVTRMINDSNSDQRQATSSSFCEEVFSSVTDHAADLAHDIDIILQDQEVRQRHHPGEQNQQNRKDGCYSVDFIDGCGEEQYNIQSLNLD